MAHRGPRPASRPSAAQLAEDEDDDFSDEAPRRPVSTAKSRPSQKRARPEEDEEDALMADQDDDSSNGNSQRGAGRAPKNKAQKNAASKKRKQREEASEEENGGFSEIGGDEEASLLDEQDWTQNQPRAESDAGIVEQVELINFMCHDNLKVELKPQLNWITGQNGSGKSAILTALTVGMGGKIRFTGRGSSLAAAVQQGKNAARIIIRLKNQGPDAYRPHDFGKSIIIERKISSKGASSYSIKSATGQVIGHTAADLHAIVDHFDIQVDNECAILMQETSKRFLHGDSPTKKYQLFLKATQLEKMRSDLSSSNENLKKMARELKGHETRLPELEERYKHLEEKYQQLEALERSKEDLKAMKIRLAWSVVAQLERDIVDLRKTIEAKEESKEEYNRHLADAEKDAEKCRENLAAKMADVNAAGQKLATIREELGRLNHEREQRIRDRGRRNHEVNHAKQAVQTVQKRLKQAQDSLAEAQQKQLQDTQTEMDSRQQEIVAARREVDDLKAQIARAAQAANQVDVLIAEKEQEISGKRNRMDNIRREMDRVDREKKTLEQSRQHRDMLFGERVPRILEVIRDNVAKFRKPPIGPIGKYLSVVDDRYAMAIEAACGALFSSFICSCREDQNTFEELLRSKGITGDHLPTVIVTQYLTQERDVSGGTVEKPFKSILSLLKSSNPTCTKVLVDMQRIEQLIVVDTHDNDRANRDEAIRILKEIQPRNLKEVFLLNGDHLLLRRRALVDVPSKGRQPRLISDPGRGIQSLQARFRDLENEWKQEQALFNSLNTELTTLRRDPRKEQARQTQQLNRQIVEKTQLIRELEAQRPPDPPSAAEIGELEEAVSALQQSLEQKKQELDAIENSASQLHTGMDDLQAQIADKDAQIKSLMDDNAKLDRACQQATSTLQRIEMATTKLKDMVAAADAEIRNTQDTITRKESSIREATAKASQIGDRPAGEITETYQAIETRLRLLARAVDEQAAAIQAGETFEQIKRDLDVAKQAYYRMKTLLSKMGSSLKRMENCVRSRVQRWKHFRNSISRRTNSLFLSYLSQKGFDGKLEFDHNSAELRIIVNPDHATAGSGAGSTSTLSGGERSFSTVSLMLSLWDTMEVPFRAMDEFDVYMDAGNRKVAIDLLNNVGREKSHRQHIFLTPQDMPFMGKDVNVLRLEPPRQ